MTFSAFLFVGSYLLSIDLIDRIVVRSNDDECGEFIICAVMPCGKIKVTTKAVVNKVFVKTATHLGE